MKFEVVASTDLSLHGDDHVADDRVHVLQRGRERRHVAAQLLLQGSEGSCQMQTARDATVRFCCAPYRNNTNFVCILYEFRLTVQPIGEGGPTLHFAENGQ